MTDVEMRFYDKVRVGDGCWEWTGSLDKRTGYGWFKLNGRMWGSHRVALALVAGEMPSPDVHVCHTCDNRRCVRPGHLFVGTNQDNVDDRQAKGRQARGPALGDALRSARRRRPEIVQRGEDHGRARLTEVQVVEIRRRVASGEVQARLAAEYGVSTTAISRIVRQRYWRHVVGGEA